MPGGSMIGRPVASGASATSRGWSTRGSPEALLHSTSTVACSPGRISGADRRTASTCAKRKSVGSRKSPHAAASRAGRQAARVRGRGRIMSELPPQPERGQDRDGGDGLALRVVVAVLLLQRRRVAIDVGDVQIGGQLPTLERPD